MYDKAMIAVSFGTSVPEAEAAIEHVEAALRAACPDRKFLRAYTSRIICRKLAREGRPVLSPEAALEQLESEGCRDVVIQPTHLTPGDEYEKLCRIAAEYAPRFDTLRVGKPLIAAETDLLALTETVCLHYPVSDEALLLMGHGSNHIANMIYPALQTAFRLNGRKDVFVGTVEGWPGLTECLRQLMDAGYRTVSLAPLMLVAGDHAINDMAGDEEDSWKSVLQNHGFAVNCTLEGLGQWNEIAALYRTHLELLLAQ